MHPFLHIHTLPGISHCPFRLYYVNLCPFIHCPTPSLFMLSSLFISAHTCTLLHPFLSDYTLSHTYLYPFILSPRSFTVYSYFRLYPDLLIHIFSIYSYTIPYPFVSIHTLFSIHLTPSVPYSTSYLFILSTVNIHSWLIFGFFAIVSPSTFSHLGLNCNTMVKAIFRSQHALILQTFHNVLSVSSPLRLLFSVPRHSSLFTLTLQNSYSLSPHVCAAIHRASSAPAVSRASCKSSSQTQVYQGRNSGYMSNPCC